MKNLSNVIMQLIAIIILITGLVLLPFPIPGPGLLVLVGLALLVVYSHRTRQFVQRKRHKHPRFNQMMHKGSRFLPKRLREGLHQTNPPEPPAQNPDK